MNFKQWQNMSTRNQKIRGFIMKKYIAKTNDGDATIYANSLHEAWEQAVAIFTEVLDVNYHTYA